MKHDRFCRVHDGAACSCGAELVLTSRPGCFTIGSAFDVAWRRRWWRRG